MNAKKSIPILTLAVSLCWLAACNPATESVQTYDAANGIPDSVIVPPADVARMIANYAPRAGYVIRDGDTLPNTRSITFELELLEAFLAEVRNQGAERVTIHLAAYDAHYPDTASFMPEPRYWGYNTVLLAPAGGSGAPVDIGTFSGGGGRPVVNKGELKPPTGGPTL